MTHETLVVLAALISLVGSAESVITVIAGALTILGRIRASASEQAEYNFMTKTMWADRIEEGRREARRTGALQRRSPERLNPEVAQHFAASDFGARLRAFYGNLIAKDPAVTEA